MFASLIVMLYSLINLVESLEHTDRCHTNNDCTVLQKCSSNGFCVISIFKVEAIVLAGTIIACAALGVCIYSNVSLLIRRHVEYSEIVSRKMQLNEQQKEKDNGQRLDAKFEI